MNCEKEVTADPFVRLRAQCRVSKKHNDWDRITMCVIEEDRSRLLLIENCDCTRLYMIRLQFAH